MSLINRVNDCSVFHPERYVDFFVAGLHVGHTEKAFAAQLVDTSSIFHLIEEKLYLTDSLKTPEERTKAVHPILRKLKDEGFIPGWRDELYPVRETFYGRPLMSVERATISLFGVRGQGVHLNGYVKTKEGISMWIGKWSANKPTGPGKLDQLVAGGLPIGITVQKNLEKECWEEASIPASLAKNSRPAGAVSYLTERPDGLRHDLEYVFDLELPRDFAPLNTDGEVSNFFLWPLNQVKKTLETSDAFKFNSGLVVIDFLVRHGFLTPEDPDYTKIILGLNLS